MVQAPATPRIAAVDDHCLIGAEFVPSPNFDDRPTDSPIDLIVLHNISLPPGQFGSESVRRFFCNQLDFDSHPYFDQLRELRVCAHLFVDRLGGVTQFVRFDKRAWHAGRSSWQGRAECNDYSIGIELEGTDHDLFTQSQYDSLVLVCDLLIRSYDKLTSARIVGHSDVAPGRKTDPGPHFDWAEFRRRLQRSLDCESGSRP